MVATPDDVAHHGSALIPTERHGSSSERNPLHICGSAHRRLTSQTRRPRGWKVRVMVVSSRDGRSRSLRALLASRPRQPRQARIVRFRGSELLDQRATNWLLGWRAWTTSVGNAVTSCSVVKYWQASRKRAGGRTGDSPRRRTRGPGVVACRFRVVVETRQRGPVPAWYDRDHGVVDRGRLPITMERHQVQGSKLMQRRDRAAPSQGTRR